MRTPNRLRAPGQKENKITKTALTPWVISTQVGESHADQANASSAPLSKTEIARSRSETMLRWDLERFQHMQSNELVQVQSALRHGSKYGFWETPLSWMAKRQNWESYKNIDLRRRLQDHVLAQLESGKQHNSHLDQWLDQGVLTMTRLLLLLRCAELPGKNKASCLAPSTLVNYGNRIFLKILSKAVVKGLMSDDESITAPQGERSLLTLLTVEEALKGEESADSAGLVESLQRRLDMWSEAGYWSDVFASRGTSAIVDLKASKPRGNRQARQSQEFKPLPDDYAALLAKRSLWLMREIGPNLVRMAPAFVSMYAKTAKRVQEGYLAQENLWAVRGSYAGEIVKSLVWLDSTGQPLTGMPFRLGLNGTSEKHGWLPRTNRDFFTLMAYVQTAHQIITGLAMGPRESELLDMTRGCVVNRPQDGENCYYVNSRTFKTVDAHEGEMREWPVVVQVNQAVESQMRLMSQLDAINKVDDPSFLPDVNLWGRFYLKGKRKEAFVATNTWLVSLAEAMGMDPAPGGQNFTSHRLRKTLARIVALALVDSPMVLYEIFGHRDIEMTLHYILANKDLKQEVEAIAREINVMRATEVAEVMAQAELRRLAGETLPGDLYGGCSGGAAQPLDAFVRQKVRKVHDSGQEWGVEDAIELGRLFTNAGKQWMLVRKGVICTKSPGASGPCSLKSRGRPEPSKCSSDCSHRLEREFLRDDVRGILDTAVSAYEKAVADDERGVAAYWGGQIRINIRRFADLELEFLRVPSVASYFAEHTSESLN